MTFSLGLGGGGGSYVRFSPSVNSWTLGKEEFELSKCLFDFDTLKTGWGLMAEGQAPQWQWDEVIGRALPKPSDDYKRGFSVQMYLGKSKGWAEWSSTGTGPCIGFEVLAAAAMPQKHKNPDKVLAVTYTGSKPEKVGKGSTRVPAFEITGWVPRPADEAEAPAKQETDPFAGSAKKKAAVEAGDDF